MGTWSALLVDKSKEEDRNCQPVYLRRAPPQIKREYACIKLAIKVKKLVSKDNATANQQDAIGLTAEML